MKFILKDIKDKEDIYQRESSLLFDSLLKDMKTWKHEMERMQDGKTSDGKTIWRSHSRKKTNVQIAKEKGWKEGRRKERAFAIPPAMLVPCLLHLPRTLIHPPTSDFTGSQDVTQRPNHPSSQMPPGTTTPHIMLILHHLALGLWGHPGQWVQCGG